MNKTEVFKMVNPIEAEKSKASTAVAPVGKRKAGFFTWIFRIIILLGIAFIVYQFI